MKVVPFHHITEQLIDSQKRMPLLFLQRMDNNEWHTSGIINGVVINDYHFESDSSLVVVDDIIQDSKSTTMHLHPIESTETDIKILIDFTLKRKKQIEDKFWMKELIWFLKWKSVDFRLLEKVIDRLNKIDSTKIFTGLSTIANCLSINVQKSISELLAKNGITVTIKHPKLLKEAYDYLKIDSDKIENKDIFAIVDGLCKEIKPWDDSETHEEEVNESTIDNIWIHLKIWLKSNRKFINYNQLKLIIPLVSSPIRLLILQRYFHDIRLKNTPIDTDIISQFKSSDFSIFVICRECIYHPCDSFDIMLSLLADSLLTIYKSKGHFIQTFNGVLDLLISQSDIIYVNCRPELSKILPVCEEGGIINNNFSGFITYKVVCQINETAFTKQHLQNEIDNILKRVNVSGLCTEGNNHIQKIIVEKCRKIGCSKYLHSRWFFNGTQDNIKSVNTFLTKKILIPKEDNNNYSYNNRDTKANTLSIDEKNFSIDILEKNIRTIISEYTIKNEIIIPAKFFTNNYFEIWLIWHYITPKYVIVEPKQDSVCGLLFDVYGVAETIKKTNPQIDKDELTRMFCEKESLIIKKNVAESLDKEECLTKIDDNAFRFDYDIKILTELHNKYFFHRRGSNGFLSKFDADRLCAPKLANKKNPILKLPFYWCLGKECFHNQLEKQLVENCPSWRDYKLPLLSEIMGFSLIQQKGSLYEPKQCVRDFIGMTNKAMRKYQHLKCRECGHLLFYSREGQFNTYNHFYCINIDCKQYRKEVYINNCFRCGGKGLIDSRDAKRCPNGWYICPTCLSCCDDQEYERQANRYVNEGRPIPTRIQNKIGKGHNNNGIYFCSQCGTPLTNIENKKFCPNCKKEFSQNVDEYYEIEEDLITNRHERNDFNITK